MEYCEKLFDYIMNNEKKNAVDFLNSLKSNVSCTAYGEAREKILITETAGLLNRRIPCLYVNVNELIKELFEEDVSIECVVERLCMLARKSYKEGKRNSFEKALSYIEENLLNCQLMVGSTAEYVGLSQSELIKLFRENISQTPGDYIGKSRCEKSLEYLGKNISIKEVGQIVGFSSVEAYIRTFSKHMGMTPGMWKKKNL